MLLVTGMYANVHVALLWYADWHPTQAGFIPKDGCMWDGFTAEQGRCSCAGELHVQVLHALEFC